LPDAFERPIQCAIISRSTVATSMSMPAPNYLDRAICTRMVSKSLFASRRPN
jgi:hypothetical protein